MDSDRFDTFTRLLSRGRSRRGLGSLLGGVTLGGLLSPLLVASDAGAKKHLGKKRHESGHGKRGHDKSDNAKHKGEDRLGGEGCIATGRRCPAGKRGGKGSSRRLSCERCCQGTFEIAADGKKRCACRPDGISCDSAAHCCSATCQGGVCVAATPASPSSPSSPPPPPPTCGESCAGCCDDEECLAGNSPDACGDDGVTCAVCSNPTPLCLSRTCTACTSHAQCPGNSLCDGGACLPCDVCLSGCDFSSVHAAIDAASPGSTIAICAGTYVGVVVIPKDVTLIGTGDGDDPAVDTILRPEAETAVVVVRGPDVTVTLQRLRITGGFSFDNGGGIRIGAATTTTMIDCTVTGNTVNPGSGFGFGGGIAVGSNSLLLLDGCIVTANTASFGEEGLGGGIYNGGVVRLFNGSSVSGNDPDNCAGPGIYFGAASCA